MQTGHLLGPILWENVNKIPLDDKCEESEMGTFNLH
jgi:hypothetical protein